MSSIMSDADKKRKKSSVTLWVAIGAIVLILLLLYWLFVAVDVFRDTDVNAIAPMIAW